MTEQFDIECPYDKVTLKMAALSLADKLTDDIGDKIASEANTLCDITDEAGLKKKAAEYHGLSLEMFINSPNYKILMSEFKGYLVKETIKIMQKQGLTSEEAWAFFLLGIGRLT